MTEMFSYGFMQRAFIAGVSMSLLAGLISTFIVLRRVSFLGSGISHAAFGGVALGFFLGMNPLATALVYCIAVAYAIEIISARGKLAEDASIGIFFSFSMALGIVLISLSKGYTTDLFGYLFGSILAISGSEMYLALALSIGGTAVFGIIMRDLLLVTFNEELAVINGVPVRAVKAIFLLSMAVVIVIGIKIVGIVLISALLVIPGAAAKLVTNRFPGMVMLSSLFAGVSTLLGLAVSYRFDLAPGGMIVLVLSFLFGAAFFINLKKH